MTSNAATAREMEIVVREELHRIAPDVDIADVDLDKDLREEFDIDSMDFLNLVTALSTRVGIAMPESDYPLMLSYNMLAGYLEDRANEA